MVISRLFLPSLSSPSFPYPFLPPTSFSTAVHLASELFELFAGALGALFKAENHPAIIHLALTPTHLRNLKAAYLLRGC